MLIPILSLIQICIIGNVTVTSCSKGWDGVGCDVRCEDRCVNGNSRENCQGHGLGSGACVCEEEWSGVLCEIRSKTSNNTEQGDDVIPFEERLTILLITVLMFLVLAGAGARSMYIPPEGTAPDSESDTPLPQPKLNPYFIKSQSSIPIVSVSMSSPRARVMDGPPPDPLKILVTRAQHHTDLAVVALAGTIIIAVSKTASVACQTSYDPFIGYLCSLRDPPLSPAQVAAALEAMQDREHPSQLEGEVVPVTMPTLTLRKGTAASAAKAVFGAFRQEK
eukprot:TRINITY_DN27536_c0_g1_i1.p1 TRINITY_DN27536_c0_g1~~TRINITY_DN27536_c0_g1_i1.p1  ORF type:complete len:278 (+),score=32.41 TRINITY_DN27536_c0_g1_i1:80-913(+)